MISVHVSETASLPERLWVLAVAAGTVGLTFIPYAVGWLRETPDLVFSGILFNAIDANAYLAVMQAGRDGAWLLRIPYTSEPHAGLFLYEFYLLLGHISRWLSLPPLAVYHLARGLGGLWLCWAAYDYLRVHLPHAAARKIALVLLCLGSGIGWLTQVVAPAGPEGISPADFWFMDAYAFFSILLAPHFTAAWALALTLLAAMGRAGYEPLRRTAPPAFAAGLALAIVHPKVAPAIGAAATSSAILLAWSSFKSSSPRKNGLDHRTDARAAKKPWRFLGALRVFAVQNTVRVWGAGVLGLLIPAGYYLYALKTDPVFATLARQDITLSPPFVYYVAAYGLVSLLALIGAAGVLRRRPGREWLLLVWPAVVAAMLYAPVQIQRRFILGAQVPLAGLAGIGLARHVLPRVRRSSLARWLSRWYAPRRLRRLALNLTLAVAALSNALLVAGYTLSAWGRSPALFVPRGVALAADWLGTEAGEGELTLAAYPTGNYIPARSGAHTYIGHWNLTLDFYRKEALVERIFDGATDPAERERLLQATAARYLFYGPEERRLGDFDPAGADYLRLRFSVPGVSVYEIVNP